MKIPQKLNAKPARAGLMADTVDLSSAVPSPEVERWVMGRINNIWACASLSAEVMGVSARVDPAITSDQLIRTL